jgi:hypothetical protein
MVELRKVVHQNYVAPKLCPGCEPVLRGIADNHDPRKVAGAEFGAIT